ncbi:TPA_asm: protein 2 [Ribes virus 1]|uniref:Protein 2 n=1 Tax=Ribes virus 1 TaxID=2977985 RepID=A0A9N6YJI5_9RHAB|nr:TPA_asm: protein 2 [Ribes virus 1]
MSGSTPPPSRTGVPVTADDLKKKKLLPTFDMDKLLSEVDESKEPSETGNDPLGQENLAELPPTDTPVVDPAPPLSETLSEVLEKKGTVADVNALAHEVIDPKKEKAGERSMLKKDMSKSSVETRKIIDKHYTDEAVAAQMTDEERSKLENIQLCIGVLKTFSETHELELTDGEITLIMKDMRKNPELGAEEMKAFIRGVRAAGKNDSGYARGIFDQASDILKQQTKATKDMENVLGSMLHDLKSVALDIKTSVSVLKPTVSPGITSIKVSPPSRPTPVFSPPPLTPPTSAPTYVHGSVDPSLIPMKELHNSSVVKSHTAMESASASTSTTPIQPLWDTKNSLDLIKYRFSILEANYIPYIKLLSSVGVTDPEMTLLGFLDTINIEDWSLAMADKKNEKRDKR